MEGLNFLDHINKNEPNQSDPKKYYGTCEKEVTIERAIEEMAFHEAAHFVLNVLISNQFTKEKYPDRIDFEVIKGVKFNAQVVKKYPSKFGILPCYVTKELGFFMCLSLLSGHTSYRVFINEENCCIGPMPSVLLEMNQVTYYSFELAVDRKDIPDIEKCRQILCNIFYQKEDKKIKEQILSLQKSSEVILKNPKIMKATQHVKEILLKKNPSIIEGGELKGLISEVNSIVNGIEIDLAKMYEVFEKEINCPYI